MKKFKINILFLFVIMLISFVGIKNVSASEIQPRYYTYNFYTYDWIWNYRQAAYYYIVDSPSSWNTYISQAAQNWFSTGYHTNPLYPMTRTYTRSDSPMDFHNGNSLAAGVLGQTNHYIKGGTQINGSNGVSQPTQNWLFTRILINDSFCNSVNLTALQRKMVILHEMGHVFGLAHNDLVGSIMYGDLAKTTATGVSEIDSQALVDKLS